MTQKTIAYGRVATNKTRKQESKQSKTRAKPVRTTVDLDPELYAEFTAWIRQLSVDIERTVTQAEATRGLYRQVLTNREFQRKLRLALQD